MRPAPLLAPSSKPDRGICIAITLAVAALLAACQMAPGAASPTGRTPGAQPPTASPSPEPASTGAYPRTLVDDGGTEVTLQAPPERIISLSPAITETVFALGAGDRLVGGTDFDDYPPEAAALPHVATFTGVLHEAVAGLEPDLVLAAGNNFTPSGDIDYMRDFGVKVLVLYAENVDEVLADIRLIGSALGEDEAATRIVEAMAEGIADVKAAIAALDERPRVFYQIGSEPEIYAPAPDSFIADMVALAGGEPITTTDSAVFSISVERLIDLDPEVIVLGDAQYGVCPADVAARPGWNTITAVRDGAVRPVEDTIVTRPGPRLGEGLAALALAIHPTADITPAVDAGDYCE